MSKYQEISKTFAESVQLQAQYICECCEFSNVFFSQMAEYLEWPRDQMAFAPDESAQTEEPMCTNSSVRLFGLSLLSLGLIMSTIVISSFSPLK